MHLLLLRHTGIASPDLGVRVRLPSHIRVEAERTNAERKTAQPDDLVVSGNDVPLVVERRRGCWVGLCAVPVGQLGAVLEFIDTDTDTEGK